MTDTNTLTNEQREALIQSFMTDVHMVNRDFLEVGFAIAGMPEKFVKALKTEEYLAFVRVADQHSNEDDAEQHPDVLEQKQKMFEKAKKIGFSKKKAGEISEKFVGCAFSAASYIRSKCAPVMLHSDYQEMLPELVKSLG